MPLWDTERIIACRNDHLDWMHDHFSYETLVAGEDSELDKGPGQPVERSASGISEDGRQAPAADPALVTGKPQSSARSDKLRADLGTEGWRRCRA